MNKRFFRHTLLWSLMLMLALSACQTPTPIQSLQKTTQTQAASTAPAALPEVSAERLKEARAKLRPNTQDRIEYLYDSQKRPVSWMVVYDPPRTDPPQAGAFQTQMTSDLFGDPKENVFYLVAEFEPVENITLGHYLSWYSQPVAAIGGRRGHPDPWLNQEGCVPNYEVSFRGRLHSKFPEYRYARVPSGFYNPNDPYWYLNSRRTIEVRVPPRLIPRNGGYTVSVLKEKACDGTSPAISFSRVKDAPTPGVTPSPEPVGYYCSRRMQTLVLDVEENRLLGIDNEVRSLEQDLPEEGFQTQMHRPLAAPRPAPRSANFGTQGYYGDSPFFTPPSGAPPPDPTPPPSEDAPPPEPYTNLIPIEEAQAQLDRLKALATGLESRLETLSDYYNQTLSSMEEPDDDDGFEQQEYLEGQLATTEQLQESLKPAAKTLAQVTAELEMVCNHDEPPVNQPRLDVIYAGMTANGTIEIEGRAFGAAASDLSQLNIVPDFDGDIELQEAVIPVWQGETSRFKIKIPFDLWDYSDKYFQKVEEGLPQGDFNYAPLSLWADINLVLKNETPGFSVQDQNGNGFIAPPTPPRRTYPCEDYVFTCMGEFKVEIEWQKYLKLVKEDIADAATQYDYSGLSIAGITPGVAGATFANTAIDLYVPETIVELLPIGIAFKLTGTITKQGIKYAKIRLNKVQNWTIVKNVIHKRDLWKQQAKIAKGLANIAKQYNQAKQKVASAAFQELKMLGQSKLNGTYFTKIQDNINEIAHHLNASETGQAAAKMTNLVSAIKEGELALQAKKNGYILDGLATTRVAVIKGKQIKQEIDLILRKNNSAEPIYIEVKSSDRALIGSGSKSWAKMKEQATRYFEIASANNGRVQYLVENTTPAFRDEIEAIAKTIKKADGTPMPFDKNKDIILFKDFGYSYHGD